MDCKTFQPLRGHRKHGALRIGEMEMDAIAGHGMALNLNSRFLLQSDGCVLPWCNTCGLPATVLSGGRLDRVVCYSCARKAMAMHAVCVPDIFWSHTGRATALVVAMLWAGGIALEAHCDDV